MFVFQDIFFDSFETYLINKQYFKIKIVENEKMLDNINKLFVIIDENISIHLNLIYDKFS
jgi:hypothetical protein